MERNQIILTTMVTISTITTIATAIATVLAVNELKEVCNKKMTEINKPQNYVQGVMQPTSSRMECDGSLVALLGEQIRRTESLHQSLRESLLREHDTRAGIIQQELWMQKPHPPQYPVPSSSFPPLLQPSDGTRLSTPNLTTQSTPTVENNCVVEGEEEEEGRVGDNQEDMDKRVPSKKSPNISVPV